MHINRAYEFKYRIICTFAKRCEKSQILGIFSWDYFLNFHEDSWENSPKDSRQGKFIEKFKTGVKNQKMEQIIAFDKHLP